MGFPHIQESADHLKWEVLPAECSVILSAKRPGTLENTRDALQMARVLETLS